MIDSFMKDSLDHLIKSQLETMHHSDVQGREKFMLLSKTLNFDQNETRTNNIFERNKFERLRQNKNR